MRYSTITHVVRQFGLTLAILVTITACRPITQLPTAPPTASEPMPTATVVPASTEVKALPAAGKTVQTNDIVTYYEEYGQGEPLILLHGSFSSSADFAALIPELAKEFKVFALDSRGRGRTTDTTKPISYIQMMSDTVAFMDAIGIDKAHVIGVSDGAVIGLDMAIHHPERLSSLVAFGAGWDGTRMAPWYPDWITSATIDDLKDWANAYRAVSPHPERAELVLEKIRAMQLAPKKITVDLLKTVPVPVLVMDGQKEEFFSLDLANELAETIPGAELKMMEGTGHFAMFEKPEEFNAVVLDYLRRHEGSTAVDASVMAAKKPVLLVLQELSDDMDYMLTNEIGVMIAMLEKAGYNVVTASATGQPLVGKSTTLTPDMKLADVNVGDYAGVMVPCLAAPLDKPRPPEAAKVVKEAAARGMPIAAQTSGVLILGDAGALEGKQYAMFRDFVPLVTGGTPNGEGVIQDGNIITSGICPFMGKHLARPDGTTELTQKMINALESNR